MALRNRIGLALAVWLGCEIVAFAFVVQAIGLAGAILLGIATTLAGGSLLKRTGAAALSRLRQQSFGQQDGIRVVQGELDADNTLAALGAMLLLLPGFVTDALGLVLAWKTARLWIGQKLAGLGVVRNVQARAAPQTPHGPVTIDLPPEDWRPLKD